MIYLLNKIFRSIPAVATAGISFNGAKLHSSPELGSDLAFAPLPAIAPPLN